MKHRKNISVLRLELSKNVHCVKNQLLPSSTGIAGDSNNHIPVPQSDFEIVINSSSQESGSPTEITLSPQELSNAGITIVGEPTVRTCTQVYVMNRECTCTVYIHYMYMRLYELVPLIFSIIILLLKIKQSCEVL